MADAPKVLPTHGHIRNTEPISTCWYATDLSRWEDSTAQISTEEDLLLEGKAYRRLTPEYYAWLRSRMQHAQHKHQQGLLPATVYDKLRERFNLMQDEAITHYGEASLLEKLETLDIQRYTPPSAQSTSRLQALLQETQSAGRADLMLDSGFGEARASLPDPNAPPELVVGVPVKLLGGGEGVVMVIHPTIAELPGGWVEVQTTDGKYAQADARYITDVYGRRLVPMSYTTFEQRAIALAVEERVEDFVNILPELNYPSTGTWRFRAKVELLDYIKVEKVEALAMELGWSYADLYQNRGQLAMPCGQDYGLICFVHGQSIGSVSAEAIELFPEKDNSDHCTHFHRPQRQEEIYVTTAET